MAASAAPSVTAGRTRCAGVPLDTLTGHRLVVSQRHAQIAAHDSAEKRAVLNNQRPIETQSRSQLLDLFLRGAFAQHGLRRVAGDEMNQEKDQRGHAQQHGDREKESPDEIAQH